MRSMFSEDKAQLRQIDTKLAELMALSLAEQSRKQCLIEALHTSRTELLRPFGRAVKRHLLAA